MPCAKLFEAEIGFVSFLFKFLHGVCLEGEYNWIFNCYSCLVSFPELLRLVIDDFFKTFLNGCPFLLLLLDMLLSSLFIPCKSVGFRKV